MSNFDPGKEAALLAIKQYNNDSDFRNEPFENGNVIWFHAGRVSLGVLRDSDSDKRVSPYRPEDLEKIQKLLNEDLGHEYLGDLHTHTREDDSWLKQYPSWEDIEYESALCDIWPPPPDAPDQTAFVKIAPRLQLVQSTWFGDVFVLERSAEREVFSTPLEQREKLRPVGLAYERWYQAADRRHGAVTVPCSHAAFVKQVQSEISLMNESLSGRARFRFFENSEFQCDEETAE